MYSLQQNPILKPHQLKLLSLFFSTPISKNFFLTGGTALSAFYLVHRESEDLDLFTMSDFDTLTLRTTISEIAQKTASKFVITIRSATYQEIFLQGKGWRQKIDFVKDQPVHFGKLVYMGNITIDSLVNIATNKMLAVYGRLEVKDYIDLFIIFTKTDLSFDEMFELAKKKDKGLSEFYFATTITDVDQFKILPKMRVPLDRVRFKKFYQDLSKKILLKIKPK